MLARRQMRIRRDVVDAHEGRAAETRRSSSAASCSRSRKACGVEPDRAPGYHDPRVDSPTRASLESPTSFMSVGIEDADDLGADLERALDAI
jgi:hypothetical protein